MSSPHIIKFFAVVKGWKREKFDDDLKSVRDKTNKGDFLSN